MSGDRALKTNRLSVRTLFLVIFILVSSGPFGVEEMVSSSGPGVALLMILVIPIVWGGPLALVCTELASALPQEGGAYVWVERGLGRFWAFQSGWWSTISGLLDTAVYVVLAVTYANTFLEQGPLVQWMIAVGIIALFAALNVRSLTGFALSSAGFAVLILLPCAVLTVLGFMRWRSDPFVPFVAPGESSLASVGLGLTVAIWFYSGYESVSTMAGEIQQPQRVIPRALLLALPAVIAVYFLPTAAALASFGRWSEWGDDGYTLVEIAADLGGPLLWLAMLVASLVSSVALYNAYLAANARTTLVMAEDKLLPAVFGKVHPRWGTPYASILIAAGIHAVLATGSFEALLVIDVFLFVMNYLLIFVASVALRVREPALARPFRVPVGTAGMLVVVGVPMVVGLFVMIANGVEYLIYGSAVAATGPLVYLLMERRRKRIAR